ncbi:SsgA family sporulation/cell division regulator [Kitasatospora sp. NPDC006697]|uniref:SsgA family sporulation/cell division regulator n=1 Tax=Kitasatospora sp. NPDC006697 TaxID=3364020 RepID=UPI0036B4FDD2
MTEREPAPAPARPAPSCAMVLLLEVVGAGGLTVPVPATLAYRSAEPYAVRLELSVGAGEPVRWVFARELLRTGLRRAVGDGDVSVRPGTGELADRVVLTLVGEDSTGRLRVGRADLRRFLRRTEELVPAGREHEHLDLDALIGRLLAGPTGRP